MKKFDLTQGGIVRKLLLVAGPIMGVQLMQMSYNLADMFFLGLLPDGADAVAASGTAGMFMWLGVAFMFVGRMGAEIGVSQNLGRGDQASAIRFSQTALILAALFGIGYGLAAVFGSNLMIGVFGIREAHVAEQAAAYLRIVGVAMPFFFINSAIAGIFSGAGNARVPFKAIAVGVLINIGLDPIFIFTLDMGVRGAAIATVIAQGVIFIILIIFLKRHKDRPFDKIRLFIRPPKAVTIQIFKWTWPMSCESLFFTILTMMVTRIVANFGADALAVMRVGSQIESLSWLIAAGFGSAITAFTGQNFGALKWSRIHKGRQLSAALMGIYGVLVTLAMFFLARQMAGLFLREEYLLDMGVTLLRILALCQIAACLEGVSSGILRGMGKTLPPSIISITSNLMRLPICYFLSQTALGLEGIWIGFTIGAAVRGFAMFAWCWIDARKRPKADVAELIVP